MSGQAPESSSEARSDRRRKSGLATGGVRSEADVASPSVRFARSIAETRWALAFALALLFVTPWLFHPRHPAPSLLITWLISAAIVRLVILIIDRAPAGMTRCPSPTSRSRTWTVRYALLALLAILAVGLCLSAIRSAFGWGWPEATKGALIVDLLFLLVLVPLHRSGRLGLIDLGIRRTPRKLAVGLFLLGLSAVTIFDEVWRTLVSLPRIEDGLAGLPDRSTLVIVLTGVALCASAPIVEEIFFRGFLYRSLRNRLAVLPAALIVATIFGLGHTQYPQLERPQQAVFGFVVCLMYERSGSLLPCIALHVLLDASAFEFALSGRAWIVPCSFVVGGIVLLYGGAVRARMGRLGARARPRTV